jgi:hypothetical protein
LQSENFEKFSVYKFSLDYPNVCRLEFNPKSRREAGDIVFHFPDREKLYVSWGNLEVARKRFKDPQDHAEHGLKTIMRGRGVSEKDSQRETQQSLQINSHDAVYNSVKLGELIPGLFLSKKRIITRRAYSVHVHCDKSNRYFVIYSLVSPNAPEDFGELLLTMARSLTCH